MNRLRFDDFAAAQAGGADADALGCLAYAGVHWAQIDVPAPLGDVVSVADAVPELRLLAADITLLCHDCCRSFQRPLRKPLFYRIQGFGTIPRPTKSSGRKGGLSRDAKRLAFVVSRCAMGILSDSVSSVVAPAYLCCGIFFIGMAAASAEGFKVVRFVLCDT